VDAEENQHQVSLRAHRPWKSLRDSHIPTAATTVEKWKAQGRLPTFPLLFLFLFPTSNAKNKPRQRNLWVTDTVEWCRETRPAYPLP